MNEKSSYNRMMNIITMQFCTTKSNYDVILLMLKHFYFTGTAIFF